MSKYLLHISLILFPALLFSQRDFRFRNFTISDGLSQSYVTSIVQDAQNSMWIGTQDGLNRYDGRTFEVYSSDNTPNLKSEYIRSLALDNQNNIWIGTNNGLAFYNQYTESFKTFFPTEGETFQIKEVAVDANGEIWLATVDRGLFKFDPGKKQFSDLSGFIPSKKVLNLLPIGNNELVVATEDNGIYLLNTRSRKTKNIRTLKNGAPIPVIQRLKKESDNNVIVATNEGVYDFNVKEETLSAKFPKFQKLTGNISISDVSYYHDLGWLIATRSEGLYVIYEDGEIHHMRQDIFQKTALLNDGLNLVFKDNSGTLWIGTQRGLSNFDPEHKGFLGVGPSGNESMGIPTATVWSFAESPTKQYIYVGTDKGVSRYNRRTGEFRQFYRSRNSSRKEVKDETSTLAIEVISDQHLIIGCADGLYELTISEGDYAFKEIDLKDKYVAHSRAYSIQQWKGSRYFVATKGGAILFDVQTKQLEFFEHDPTNAKKTISSGICRLVKKDRKGRIWFSTSAGGLNYVAEEKGELIIKPYRYNSTIRTAASDYITSLHEDKKGAFWMGTFGSGLIRWDEKTKKLDVFDKTDGLPNNVIYSVLEDKEGNLWLSSNKGLSAFNPLSGRVRNYSEMHGLTSNEFNIGAYLMSSWGELFFGGINGYNHFKPNELAITDHDISVVFTRFKLENEWLRPNAEGSPLKLPLYLTKEINLGYRQRSFTIRFQSSNLSNPELVNYKYILEGLDQGEILIGTDNEINFNALSPGHYKLKVYARFADGRWSRDPAVIKINIAPPFWQTWWFWTALVLLVALGIRIFIRQRIEASRREQVRLEMKIQERTREIQQKNVKIEQQKKKIEEERNKVVEQQKLLQAEKDKTENLLKNVIPESTAEELKRRGKARARAYKKVSVLFTDFVGFTKISDRLTPSELVKKLDVYFTKFDNIIVKNNLEKIKTIGDAYMCAGGVPVRNNTNPMDTVLAALQIQAYMQKRKNDAIANGREYWELRLGINTGEVTAGVIGSERLAYDIWGATVNQAQRMEMLGEPGKVTITGATFDLIEPYFECTFKGKAQSKSRGLIDMYVVEQIKPELSVKGEGVFPNGRFNQIVNLHLYSSINYYKAERHIVRLLEKHLSKKLYYHSIAHTRDVVSAVERLALLENVTDEGLFLLKSAATYHDAGFIEQYDANEPIGARLADEILPKYGYTQKHIKRIKDLIYVTQIPHQPKNHLEEIMCDADLDYLGRDDFHEISDKLRLELREHGKIDSDREWDQIQVKFFHLHKYFTKTAIETRQKKKDQNLEEILERIERDEYKD